MDLAAIDLCSESPGAARQELPAHLLSPARCRKEGETSLWEVSGLPHPFLPPQEEPGPAPAAHGAAKVSQMLLGTDTPCGR